MILEFPAWHEWVLNHLLLYDKTKKWGSVLNIQYPDMILQLSLITVVYGVGLQNFFFFNFTGISIIFTFTGISLVFSLAEVEAPWGLRLNSLYMNRSLPVLTAYLI